MKTYSDFITENNTSFTFNEEAAAEAYHEYKMEQYKNEGLILLPDRLTAENGAKSLLLGEFIENIQIRKNHVLKHAISWTTIKDIYKKVVENYRQKDFSDYYARATIFPPLDPDQNALPDTVDKF